MFVAVLSDYGGLFCFLKIDQLFFWNTCERGNCCSFPEQQLPFQSRFSLFLINKNCLGVLTLKDYILQVQQQWPHRYFVSCPSKRGLISGAVLKMLCSWLKPDHIFQPLRREHQQRRMSWFQEIGNCLWPDFVSRLLGSLHIGDTPETSSVCSF